MDKGTGSRKAWEYVDFELEVGDGGPRKYPVSVRSPAGEAHGEMLFPFEEWELENKLLTVENTLLRSGETRRRIPSQQEQPVQDFGRSLLQALLVGEVRTRYEVSLSEARRQNKGLRLKLRIHPPDLARLPWEFLYDPDRDEYLSLSSKTPLVRYLDLRQPVEQLPVSPPLRILGMVSSARDLPVLDVEHEKRLVEEAIKGLQTNSMIEMTWLEGQTWSDLQEAMWGGPWHVFHFIGHGGFDEASQEGAIALADESGRKHLLGARNLARLLDDHYSLRLVLLNSCEGARSSVRDAFSSTAATLVRRGVPAVVAMQYEITDRAAIAFARVFYRAVASGLPVDAGVAAGRTAVSIDSALEWGTPVLYMRSPDGRIFDIATSPSRTEPPPKTEDRQEEDSLSRYRENVELAWEDGKLQANEVQRLKDLANELALERSAIDDVERDVTGNTIETILARQEGAAKEEERNRRLEELYDHARRLHRDRNWQAVIDVFERIRAEDPVYPDREGLLASAREVLEVQESGQWVAALYAEGQQHMDAEAWQQAIGCFEEVQRLEPGYQDNEVMLSRVRQELEEGENARRYREALESAWADGELDNDEAESLIDLANNNLGLSPKTAVDIEYEVIGDTIDGILERQKQAAREQDRKRRLDALYRQARRSHHAQDWQAVVDLFAQIHSVDPKYSDNDGLLVSAREALEIARREDALRQYREAVEKAWADKRVSYAEAEHLSALASELGLSADTVADIEHRAIGATKEELLGRQKGTVKWYSDEKGYGFISPDDGSEDIFVYLSGTVGKGLKSLQEGVKVTYEVHQGRTGSRATNVRRVDPLN